MLLTILGIDASVVFALCVLVVASYYAYLEEQQITEQPNPRPTPMPSRPAIPSPNTKPTSAHIRNDAGPPFAKSADGQPEGRVMSGGSSVMPRTKSSNAGSAPSGWRANWRENWKEWDINDIPEK